MESQAPIEARFYAEIERYLPPDSRFGEEEKPKGQLKPIERELYQEVVTSLGYNPRIALFIVFYSKAQNMGAIYDFVTSDPEGKYPHLFMDYKEVCAICGSFNGDNHLERNLFRFRRMQSVMRDVLTAFNGPVKPKQPLRSFTATDRRSRPLIEDEDPQSPIAQLRKSLLAMDLDNSHADPYYDYGTHDLEAVKSSIPLIECQICMNEFPNAKILTIQGVCHQVCKECFSEYLIVTIESGKVQQMKCPHCQLILSLKTIQDFTSVSHFAKYKKFFNDSQVNKDPLLRWCPNPFCGKVIKLPSKNVKKGVCEECKKEICPKCNKDYHQGKKCSSVMDKEVKDFLKGNDAEKCPKCGIIVVKVNGCNHMTCGVCEYEWCWLCGATYTRFHFAPINPLGCPNLQSSDNTRKTWSYCKIILFRIFLLILFVLAIPFLMVASGPVLMLKAFATTISSRWNLCSKIFLALLFFLIGIALDVIFIPILILSFPVFLIVLLFLYCKERIKLTRKYKKKMRMRQQRLERK